MLRARYTAMNLFDLMPALSMALDPVLTQLDRLLDDDILFQAVKADLAHRFPRTLLDGRPSTPVEVIQPCYSLIHCQMLGVHAVSQRVSHHNLGLGTRPETEERRSFGFVWGVGLLVSIFLILIWLSMT